MPTIPLTRRGATALATLAICLSTALGLSAAPDASAASGWAPTASMDVGRSAAAAVVLDDGRVLVAGGSSGIGPLAASEIYDPATGTWTPTGSLNTGRSSASMTLLEDGTVLIAGGTTSGATPTGSAELYDPATGVWTPAAPMLVPRSGHQATLGADGRVLMAGGDAGFGVPALTHAELYDPAANTWTATGALIEGRENHAQVRLADGQVLVAGGHSQGPLTFRSSAELWDPATGTWSATGTMAVARTQGGFARLNDGSVLFAGGVNGGGFVLTGERYDPAAGSWSPAGSIPNAGNVARAATLSNGQVLFVNDGPATNPVLFDPGADAFGPAGTMGGVRSLPTLTALPDGRVLIAGGTGAGGLRLSSAELWTGPTSRTVADTDFGSVTAGEEAERDVTVRNTGTLPLFVTGVSVGGSDAGAFSVVSDSCTGARVGLGDDCTVRVRFTAAGTGVRTAQLLVADNADGAAVPVLTGTAVAAPGPPEPPVPPVAASAAAAPVIEALDRHESDPAGGGVLEITGANFGDDTVVRFGDVVAPTTVLRYDRLRVVVPAHAPGTVAVTARTAWGTSPPAAFTYVAPRPGAGPGPAGQAPGARCVVPKLRGLRVRGARSALTAAGCKLGTVRRTTRRTGPRRAEVVAQGQRAGTTLAAGAVVDVTTRRRRG